MVYDRSDRVNDHDAALVTHWYQLLKNAIHLKQATPFEDWSADDAELPVTNPAQLHTRGDNRVLGFRGGTNAEYAHFPGVLGHGYNDNGLVIDLWWGSDTALSGSVLWKVQMEALNSTHDIDTTAWSATPGEVLGSPHAGNAGQIVKSRILLAHGAAEMDSLTVGQAFRLRVWRDATHASDDMIGDADLLRVILFEQPDTP